MGDVLPFIAKVRASGDWTAAERARLEELGRQFADSGLGVEVVFGTTDDGDPWCVVKDQNEEVLVHVARIGGRFVVHYAVDDAIAEGADLPMALAERLAPVDEAPEGDVVVPFSLAGRQAQTFIALIVATAFFYETSAAVVADQEPAEELAFTPDLPPPPAPADDDALTEKREVAAQAVALSSDSGPEPRAAVWVATAAPAGAAVSLPSTGLEAPDAPELPPLAASAAPERLALAEASALNLILGGDGDDRLVGSAGSDHIVGGAGDDTLSGGGAGAGGYDLLQGGDGDDRIEIDARTVAEGGAGADTFVIAGPAVMGQADTLLGVILDLRVFEGDRLLTDRGGTVTVRPTPPSTDGEVGVEQQPPAPEPTSLVPGFGPGRRVEVDLDGDGVIDGYVWVLNKQLTPDGPVLITGQALGTWDPLA